MIITLFLCLCILLFIIVAYFIDFSPVPLPLIPMIVFIMLTFIVVFIHKVRKQCKKFGTKNVFRMSYHGKQIEMEDYVCAMLEQVPGFHKIEKWGETIVYLNDTGIYLIQCFKEKGTITGNINDETLICSRGNTKEFVINPLPDFQNKVVKLEKALNTPVTPYLVTENNCQFLMKENSIPTVFLKSVYNDVIRYKEKRYSNQEVLKYHQLIQQLIENDMLQG